MDYNSKREVITFRLVMCLGEGDMSGVSVYAEILRRICTSIKGCEYMEVIYNAVDIESPEVDAIPDVASGYNVYRLKLPIYRRNVSECVNRDLKCFVADDIRNIFMINFFPSSFVVEGIRKAFPSARIVQTVHDMIWLSECGGDIGVLEKILLGRDLGERARLVRASWRDMEYVFANVDRVVALCQQTYGFIRDQFDVEDERLCYIPNALPEENLGEDDESVAEFRRYVGIPADADIYLAVGRLTYSKGIDKVAEMLPLLLETNPKAVVVCIGNCDDFGGKVVADIRASCYSKRFFTPGAIDRPLLLRLYRDAKRGLVMSRHEQCSMVGLEMIRAGLAVIHSDGWGVPEMFSEERESEGMWYYNMNRMRDSYRTLLIELI